MLLTDKYLTKRRGSLFKLRSTKFNFLLFTILFKSSLSGVSVYGRDRIQFTQLVALILEGFKCSF